MIRTVSQVEVASTKASKQVLLSLVKVCTLHGVIPVKEYVDCKNWNLLN